MLHQTSRRNHHILSAFGHPEILSRTHSFGTPEKLLSFNTNGIKIVYVFFTVFRPEGVRPTPVCLANSVESNASSIV